LLRQYGSEQRPELWFFLARLAAAQGQGVLARDLMRRYLQEPDRENHAARQALAQLYIDEPPPVGVLLGELTITGPRGAWARIDGQLVGVLPLVSSQQVAAGVHSIVLESAGRRLSAEAWVTARFATDVRFNLESKTVFSSAPPPLLTLIAAGSPRADDALSKRVYAALQEAAKREGLLLMSRDEALQLASEPSACLDTLSCQLDLARRSEAMGILRIQLDPASSVDASGAGSRIIQAQFADLVAGQILSTVKDRCEACREGETIERTVQVALRSYVEAWSRPRGRVLLTARPDQAVLRVNGGRLPRLPFTLVPLAGSISVEASAPGFRSSQRYVTVPENQAITVDIALENESLLASASGATSARDAVSLRSRILFFGGIATVGAGVILGGFGVSALSIHGQCGSSAASGMLCPEVYDTRGKGGALLGVGLGLSIVGTLGIALGRDAVQRRNH
jgi:hypothetical protein